MTLINVAINFGYEYFCFVIYFSKFYFQNFFVKIFFLTFFGPNFFFKIFFQLFFQYFFLEGFTLDASPFTGTKLTLCICVMKNMIYSKRSKLDFSFV